MTTTPEVAHWVADVKQDIREVAGDWADEAATGWDRHATRPKVCVTIYGSYNSGKSSLLKRFLVTDGTPVPDWLIIGAKPTSDDIDQVDSGGLTWIDTPGFAAGNDQHEALAHRSIVLTDALLVVLPPQMLSTDIGRIAGLVDGSFYNPATPEPLFPRGALVLVIAQMDKAGIDPRDDLDGYHELVAAKRAELVSSLTRQTGSEPAVGIHLIAADPRQVGRRDEPTAPTYAGSESWDGVAGLRAKLDELAGRRTELRSGAAVRYWSWLAGRARTGADEELDRLAEIIGEAERQKRSIKLIRSELATEDKAARTRLRQMILDALTAVRGDDVEARRAELEKQLDKTVGTWLEESNSKLIGLARRAAIDFRARAERPAAENLRAYLDDLGAADILKPAESASPGLQRLLDRFEQHARTVARSGYKLFNGLSPEEARTELAQLRFLDAAHLERYYTSTESLLNSAKQAEDVRRRLRQLDFFEDTLPVVAEAGGVIVGAYLDHRDEQRRIAQQIARRAQAEKIMEAVVADGSGSLAWSQVVASFGQSLDAAEVPEDVVKRTAARHDLLTKTIAHLTELLEHPPVTSSTA